MWIIARRLSRLNAKKTKMIALFMNYIDRWLLCHDAIRIGDWCVHEIEWADWVPFFAATGKPQYCLEGKHRLEATNALEYHELEYYWMGRFVCMTGGKAFMTHDDFCEKQNGAQKNLPSDNNWEGVRLCSTHLHGVHRARKEMFPSTQRDWKSPDTTEDVNHIYDFYLCVFYGQWMFC